MSTLLQRNKKQFLQTAVLDCALCWKSFTTTNNDPLFTLKNTTVKRENWEVYWSQAQVPLGHTILLSGIRFCSQHWIGQWETSMLDQRAYYQGNIASYHGQFSEKRDWVCQMAFPYTHIHRCKTYTVMIVCMFCHGFFLLTSMQFLLSLLKLNKNLAMTTWTNHKSWPSSGWRNMSAEIFRLFGFFTEAWSLCFRITPQTTW